MYNDKITSLHVLCRGTHNTDSSSYLKTSDLCKVAQRSHRPKLITSSDIHQEYVTTQQVLRVQGLLFKKKEPKCVHTHSRERKSLTQGSPKPRGHSPRKGVRIHSRISWGDNSLTKGTVRVHWVLRSFLGQHTTPREEAPTTEKQTNSNSVLCQDSIYTLVESELW